MVFYTYLACFLAVLLWFEIEVSAYLVLLNDFQRKE